MNDDPTIELPANYSFEEDASLTVDLSQNISDPDGDDLTLTVSNGEYINVDLDGYTASFSAQENWFGSEIFTFTVEDDQGRAAG